MIPIVHGRSTCARRLTTLALVAVSTVSTMAFAGPISKFTNEGASARAFGYSGCLWVSLEVGRGGSKQAPQTWLYYDVYDYCSWVPVAFGYGTIPNSAFTIGNKEAQLSLTTGNSPGFFTDGATGTISVSFTPDGLYQESFTGHTTVKSLSRTVRWHGSSSYESATAEGTLVGVTFTQLSGQLGEGRGKEITVEHAAK